MNRGLGNGITTRERVKKLKYTPKKFYGILASNMHSHKYSIFKELLFDLLKNEGCYIIAYNTDRNLEEKKRKIKSWNIDYDKYLEKGQIITVSTNKEYFIDNRIDIVRTYSYYCNLIDKCRERGYKKVVIYGVRDGFYVGKLALEEFYEYHKVVKKIATDKNVMILTHFFLDNYDEEYFYDLIKLYDAFMLYDFNAVYSFGTKKFTDIEVLFRFLKTTFSDKNLLHKENKRLEFLNELILDTSYKQTNDDLLDASLRKIVGITGTDFGYIAKCTGKNVPGISIEGKYNLPDNFIKELENHKLKNSEIVDEMKKRVVIIDEEDFETFQGKYLGKKYNYKTLITVPLGINNNSASHLMFLFSSKEKKELLEYVPLLETIGNTLWILIQKQKMYEDYQNNIIKTEKLRALGELAGGIAHDFNNLLTTILGFSQVALTRELSEDIKEYFDIIYRSAIDGKKVVERILGFSRKQFNDKRDLHYINCIIESSIEMARPRWKNYYESLGNNLKIIKRLHSNSRILCVEHEIREVIINLLSNAMDAMESGGTLTINTYDVEGKVVVEISDTGGGIPEEIREEIFEPFYSTKGTNGTGLGLSIVKEIVEDHNGSVKLESSIGEGSTFKLYFDRFPEETENDENIRPVSSISLNRTKELDILVIDDIQQVGDTLVHMLETIGIHAELEVDSKKVMHRLSQKKYDIIICDLAMPKLNGVELSKIVKKQYPNTKYIIITGWLGRFKDQNHENIDYVLDKPCTIEDLTKAINSVL